MCWASTHSEHGEQKDSPHTIWRLSVDVPLNQTLQKPHPQLTTLTLSHLIIFPIASALYFAVYYLSKHRAIGKSAYSDRRLQIT